MLTDIAHRIRGRTLSEVLRHLESVARLQGLLRRAQSSTHHGPHISPYSFFLTRLMTSLCTDTLSQSALFNFQSLLLVILLLICTCTYVRAVAPRLIDSNKQGYVFSALSRCGSVFSLTFPRMTRTFSGKFSDSCPHPLIVFSGANRYLYCTRFLGIFFMFARIGELHHSSYTPAWC